MVSTPKLNTCVMVHQSTKMEGLTGRCYFYTLETAAIPKGVGQSHPATPFTMIFIRAIISDSVQVAAFGIMQVVMQVEMQVVIV